MTDTRLQAVYFIVVGGEATQLASIQVHCHEPSMTGRRLVHVGKRLCHKEPEMDDIVRDARSCESDGTQVERSIGVTLGGMNNFNHLMGRSYGIALALCDKLARYCPDRSEQPKIVTTGGIREHEGETEVILIDLFAEKLQGLIAAMDRGELQPGDCFVYPKENEHSAARDNAPLAQQEQNVIANLLHQLKERDLVLRPITHLDEMDDLWDCQQKKKTTWWRMSIPLVLLASVLCLLFCRESKECLKQTVFTQCQGQSVAECFQLEFQYLEIDSTGRVAAKPLTNEITLLSGDYFRVHFTPLQDSFVYLFMVSDGEMGKEVHELLRFVEMPHQFSAGKQVSVPPPEKIGIYLDNRIGEEQLYFVALAQDNPCLMQHTDQQLIQWLEQIPATNKAHLRFQHQTGEQL